MACGNSSSAAPSRQAHLMAVAGVAERARQPAARHAARTAALLEHLLVELVAAGCQHYALRAVVLLKSLVALHDDARHLARVVGDQLAGGAAVADFHTGLLEDAGEDAGQLAGGVGQVERRVPRARQRRLVPFVAEVGKVACGERQRVVVEVLVVEVADVPVHGFAVFLQPVAVQLHVALESAVDHGVADPSIGVVGHAPMLVQFGVRAADGGGIVVAGGLLLHGHRLEALFGAGQRRRVAGGAEAAHHHVHVVRGHDIACCDGLGHEGDLALAGGAHLHLFHHGPHGLGGVGGLHGACRGAAGRRGAGCGCRVRGIARRALRRAAGEAASGYDGCRRAQSHKERAARNACGCDVLSLCAHDDPPCSTMLLVGGRPSSGRSAVAILPGNGAAPPAPKWVDWENPP